MIYPVSNDPWRALTLIHTDTYFYHSTKRRYFNEKQQMEMTENDDKQETHCMLLDISLYRFVHL